MLKSDKTKDKNQKQILWEIFQKDEVIPEVHQIEQGF